MHRTSHILFIGRNVRSPTSSAAATAVRAASSVSPATATEAFRDYNSDKYQLLHVSEISTYHFQKSLRRLPIPKLEKSCERYLDSVRAIVDGPEVKETEQLVDHFLKGEGPELQKELKQYDSNNPTSSYISEPWFDMYLSSRVPCPVNYNPFMMFAPDPEAAYNNQLLRATNFVISCGRLKRALDAEVLAPEVFHLNPAKSDTPTFRRICRMLPPSLSWFGAVAFKAFPLDMSQYGSLFGGCRVPEKGKDRLHLRLDSRHFLVVKGGQFFTVQLFDANGKLHPPEYIYASLQRIINDPVKPKDDECVGSLTTLDRDSWADVRKQMIAVDGRNQNTLSAVEDALFLLCLDELSSADPGRLVKALLCGDDGRNRWFDKCFQLIVDGNGQTTINFEHSWGDGVAVLRLMEETLKDTVLHRFVVSGQAQQPSSSSIPVDKLVTKLDWHLDTTLRGHIKRAQQQHLELCHRLDFGVLEHKALSKQAIKAAKLSPDAIMQLGIQLAFYGLYREFVPTYESCSTAAFLKGRTECIRSATTATRETVLAFEEGKTGPAKLLQMIKKCSDVHSQLVKEASLGQGFDRHLFGLKHTAERLGRPPPPLFTHPLYQRMGHFVLSTSTLSTDTIHFGGFGPVVPDGFGIGYNVTDQRLGAAVTAYKDQRNAAKFCGALDLGLDKIRHAIEVGSGGGGRK